MLRFLPGTVARLFSVVAVRAIRREHQTRPEQMAVPMAAVVQVDTAETLPFQAAAARTAS
jgi:hypothetical protein